MRYLVMALALMLGTFETEAQETQLRDRLLGLMSMDCGIGEAAGRFRLAAIQDPSEARAVFLQVLQSGPSANRMAQAKQQAEARFDRYLAWAKRNADKPHAARFLDGTGRDAFVVQAVEDVALQYRTNALRGLELTGIRADRVTIDAAMRRQPRLAQIGQMALKAISKR